MSGGGGQQSTSSNAPPQQYLDAYSQVMGRANQAASAPYQSYPGQLQAGFSPQQQQGFDVIGSTIGMQQPYLNTAAQAYTAAALPLQPLMQPYVDEAKDYFNLSGNQNMQGALSPYQGQAAQGFGSASNADLQGSISPWQQQAAQGFNQGSQTLTPQQYSQGAISQYYNPYQQDVVDATQRQFDLSNATQQNSLRGNAASQGALGGDRFGVAQAALAGQQQSQQAPVIAGLMNQGFGQAQQEFNTQQQTNLSAQQQSAALKQQAAQGYAALGNQSLTAAQQKAMLQQQSAQGFAGLGGQSLTAAQQQAQLYNQTGQGIAALGQAELGAGQSQGWLNAQAGSGLAGLGNSAVQGALSTGNALLGAGALQQQQAQTGLNIPYQQWQAAQSYPFQTTGWLSNIAQGLGGASGGTSTSTTPGPSAVSQVAGLGALGAAGAYYGSQNGWFGAGSTATDLAAQNAASGAAAGWGGATDAAYTAGANSGLGAIYNRGGAIHGFAGGGVPFGGDGEVPDVSTSVIPGANGLSVDTGHSGGTPLIKQNYGSTTSGGGSGDSVIGSLVKGAGTIAATVYGGPAGFAAANVANQNLHFGRGGHVPILSRGFAAGGAPMISVTTMPNQSGGTLGLPVMSTDPNKGLPTSASSLVDDYLKQTAAGAYHPPATPPPAAPAPAPGPGPNQLTPDQTTQLQNMLAQQRSQQLAAENVGWGINTSNGTMAGGGTVRGFDGGGDIGDEDWTPPSADFGQIDNQPVGQRFDDWWHRRSRDDRGQAIPTPPMPPSEHNDGYDTPIAKMIGPFLAKAWEKQQEHNAAFNAETTAAPASPASAGMPYPGAPGWTYDAGSRLWQNTADPGVANPDRGEPPPPYEPLTPPPPGFGPASETHGGNWQPDAMPGFGAAPETHGGGWPALGTQAGPANTTTSGGGFGTHGPAGPPVPPPTTTGFAGSSSTAPTAEKEPYAGFGTGKRGSWDDLFGSRALKEDKANPWISLAIAGAGMLAGDSPHAAVNIGKGALAGLGNYVKTDQAAKELATKVQENRVRLAETQAYHGITSKIAQQNADTKSAAQSATAAYKAFQMANPRATPGQLMSQTIDYLMDSEGYSRADAYDRVKGLDIAAGRAAETTRHNQVTEGQGADRIQIAQQRLMDTSQYQDAVLALRQQGLDQGRIDNIMTNATRNVVMDPAGRLTIDAAVKAQTAGRATVANPATGQTIQAKPAPPDAVLKAARDAIVAGANKAEVIARLAAKYDTSALTGP